MDFFAQNLPVTHTNRAKNTLSAIADTTCAARLELKRESKPLELYRFLALAVAMVDVTVMVQGAQDPII